MGIPTAYILQEVQDWDKEETQHSQMQEHTGMEPKMTSALAHAAHPASDSTRDHTKTWVT